MALTDSNSALVIGAGIQGALAALLLAQKGLRVKLFDKNPKMLASASLNYEGRIHTGMLYSMDRSFRTADRLATDALGFAPAVERLLGRSLDWERYRTLPSKYFVHRDSHLKVDELVDFWTLLEQKFLSDLKNPGCSYLGLKPKRLFKEIDVPNSSADGVITHAFETFENCLDQVKFNNLIEQTIQDHPLIEVYLEHEVIAVEELSSSRCHVSLKNSMDESIEISSDLVVNCSWESRAIFDQSMNAIDSNSESLRLKYSVLLKTNDYLRELGSFTLTHGAFGSMVVSPTSSDVMMSWYPASIGGFLSHQQLPKSWVDQCNGKIPERIANKILSENIEGFRQIFPDFPDCELSLIKAGVIVAHGLVDIDKKESGFHYRDEFPIRRKGSYVSIATGKYGSAPRNVLLLEKELFT